MNCRGFYKTIEKNNIASGFAIDIGQKEEFSSKIYNYFTNNKFPDFLKKPFYTLNHGDYYQDNFIGYFLTNLYHTHDTQYIELADELLRKGVPLPEPKRMRTHFDSTASYFNHLIHHPRDLYIALHKTPKIIQMVDEQGQTLLHHAASQLSLMNKQPASIILFQLLRSPHANFTMQDHNGNTPLHLAAAKCMHRAAKQLIYPQMKEQAEKKRFNFACKNKKGETIGDILMHAQIIQSMTQHCSLFTRNKYKESHQTIAKKITEYLSLTPN